MPKTDTFVCFHRATAGRERHHRDAAKATSVHVRMCERAKSDLKIIPITIEKPIDGADEQIMSIKHKGEILIKLEPCHSIWLEVRNGIFQFCA